MTELKQIPINQIKENPVALRAVNKEDEKYLGLVESIRSKGILNALSVRQATVEGISYYELVDGLHRFTAAKDAGLDVVPAQILDLNDAEVLEAQMVANFHKVDTTPVQFSKQIVRLLGMNPFMTMTELAQRVGFGVTTITDRLGLLKLDSKIKELVDQDEITLANGYALAKLPVDEQANYIDSAMTEKPELFIPKVNARAKELRDAKRKGVEAAPIEFIATPHLQKLKTIKEELESPKFLAELVKQAKVTNPIDAAILAIKWVLHMDDSSINAAKEQYEARQQEKAASKARREDEKLRKQAAAADEKAAEIKAKLASATPTA